MGQAAVETSLVTKFDQTEIQWGKSVFGLSTSVAVFPLWKKMFAFFNIYAVQLSKLQCKKTKQNLVNHILGFFLNIK